MGGGRRLGNGGRPLIARHRQVLRPPNRATAGNDRIFERQRKRVQYPCQPNKKTARRRSQSLARERYWVALKIWSAWANRNQSQNPVTATKAPEKTRLERRFCVILQPQSYLIATSVPTGMIVWPRQKLFAQTVPIRLEIWARVGLSSGQRVTSPSPSVPALQGGGWLSRDDYRSRSVRVAA